MLQYALCVWLGIFVFGGGRAEMTVGSPSWESEWVIFRSHAGPESFLEFYHGLGQLPLKGKALVRPLSGPNAGFNFEAIGSSQWDDDYWADDVIYCGVVFVYNSTHCRIYAPDDFSGHAFCSGPTGWTNASGHAQVEDEVEVKILLWLQEAFPEPDLAINWTFVDSHDADRVFFEFPNPTGEQLAWVQMQVRVTDGRYSTWVSEGIGTDNFGEYSYTEQGGVIYAHDETSIRIWVRNATYTECATVVVVEDGWGDDEDWDGTYFLAATGYVRVFGWVSLGSPLFSHTVDVNLEEVGDLPGEILLNTKMWEPTISLITLQVTPLDGDNSGYVFPGTGIMPHSEISGEEFGGIQFGYTQSLVRLFYPYGPHACLIRIGPEYGAGFYQQCSRRASIKVTVWGQSQFRPVGVSLTNTLCQLAVYGTPGESPHNACFPKCLTQLNCLAVKVARTTDETCHLLDASDAMAELQTYNDANIYLIVYPERCNRL